MDITQSNADSVEQSRKVPVIFNGQANQFFSIWIVNIILSILTLGIYSAWAKVRTHRYFYSNTSIDGHVFSYLAEPLQILKGRILALILFGVFSVCVNFFPILGLIVIFLMLFLSPWLINQSLRFNNKMSSYRNVRFGFLGSYGDAFLCFIIYPVIGVLTLYIAFPWVNKKINEYIYNNITFGDKKLESDQLTSQYYITCLTVLGVSIVAFTILSIIAMIFAAITGGIASGAGQLENPTVLASLGGIMGVAMMFGYILILSVLNGIYQAQIRAHIFANSQFQNVAKFESHLTSAKFARLLFVNTLAIIFSLGLAYPWAAIRKARYLAENTQINIQPGANQVIDHCASETSAFGEEAAEVFDIDIALT